MATLVVTQVFEVEPPKNRFNMNNATQSRGFGFKHVERRRRVVYNCAEKTVQKCIKNFVYWVACTCSVDVWRRDQLRVALDLALAMNH